MVQPIAQLAVDLIAETAAFRRDMSRAASDLGSTTARMNRNLSALERGFDRAGRQASKTFRNLAAAGAAALSVRALKQVADETLRTADAIGKASRTVGLNVRDFQAYEQAAERAAISSAQFTQNLTAFVKRVGEARAGAGPLVAGLKRIDEELLANIVNARDQNEALGLVADAIANAATAADQAAIANAAFGRSGIQMVEFLDRGAVGLADFREEAEAAGTILDEDLTRQAEALNDEFSRLSDRFGRATDRVVLGFIPAINDLLETGADLLSWLADTREAFANFFLGDPDDIEAITEEIGGLQTQIEQLQTRLDQGLGGGQTAFIAQEIRRLEREVAIREARIAFLERENVVVGESTALAVENTAAANDNAESKDKQAKSVESLVQQLELENQQLVALRDAHLEGEDAVERVNDAIELQNTLLGAGVEAGSEAAVAIGELVRANQDLEREIDTITEAEEERARTFEDSADRIARSQARAAQQFRDDWLSALDPVIGGLERFLADSLGGSGGSNGFVTQTTGFGGLRRAVGDLVDFFEDPDGFQRPTNQLAARLDRTFGTGARPVSTPNPADVAAGLGNFNRPVTDVPTGGFFQSGGLDAITAVGGSLVNILNGGDPVSNLVSGGISAAASFAPPPFNIVGQVAGPLVGGLLGGLFGDGDPGPEQSIARGSPGAIQGLADNGGDAAEAVQALNAAFSEAAAIAGALGLELEVTADAFLQIDQESDAAFASIGGASRRFGSAAEATAFLVEQLVARIVSDLDPAFQLVVETIGDLELAIEAINFLRSVDTLPKTVADVRDLNQVLSPVQQQLAEINTTFDAMAAEAERLQLTMGPLADEFAVLADIEAARAAQIGFLTEQTVDDALAAFALEESFVGVEGQVVAVRRQLDDFTVDLKALGAAESDLARVREQAAARIDQIQSREVARIQDLVDAELLALQGDTLAAELARIDAFIEGLNQELEAAGVFTAERAEILDPLEDQLKAQARLGGAAGDAARAIDGLADSLQEFLDRGLQASLTASGRYAEALAVFERDFDLALNDRDADAIGRILADAADLADAAQGEFVGTEGLANVEEMIDSKLRQLGNALGIELLADGTSAASPGFKMVGERGREMMFMNGGEVVVPNHVTEQILGSGSAVRAGEQEVVAMISGLVGELRAERRDAADDRDQSRRTERLLQRLVRKLAA